MKRNPHYLLDTSALLTLREDEPGADRVADLLHKAQQGQAVCHAAFISRMELLYRVWRDEGADQARLAYEQCRSLPLTWVEFDEDVMLQAAEIKARHPLSLADAWVAASAMHAGATLVHKDPELTALKVRQEMLPLKEKRRSP